MIAIKSTMSKNGVVTPVDCLEDKSLVKNLYILIDRIFVMYRKSYTNNKVAEMMTKMRNIIINFVSLVSSNTMGQYILKYLIINCIPNESNPIFAI
jgi:hypothetical protein